MKRISGFMKHFNFFWRFFLSYCLLLAIPFGTILFTYRTASDTVKNEILTSSSNTLYQFFNVVDSKFSELKEVGFSVLSTARVQNFAALVPTDLSSPTMERYYLKELNRYFMQPDFENIFLYYPKLNYMIGFENSLDAENYYQTYYRDYFSYDGFLKKINSNGQNMIPRLVTFSSSYGTPLLGIAISRTSNPNYLIGEPEIISVILLKPGVLNQLFENASFHNDGLYMILDSAGNQVAASSPDCGAIDLSGYQIQEGVNYATFQSKEYVLHFFPSGVADCTYVSAVPSSVFWERLDTLQKVAWFSMAACMLFSFFVAWFLAKRNYTPIRGLVTVAERNPTRRNRENEKLYENEIEYVKQTLSESFHRIDILEDSLKSGHTAVMNDFLICALHGSFSPKKTGDDVFLDAGITLLSDQFGVILFSVESLNEALFRPSEGDPNPLSLWFLLANVCHELCGRKHQGFLVSVNCSQYACIVNFNNIESPDACLSDMREIALECRKFVSVHFDILCTVCLSAVTSGLTGIHTAYLQSLQALEYRFVYGKGSLIQYAETENKQFHYENSMDSKITQSLMYYISGEGSSGSVPSDLIYSLASSSGISENSSMPALMCFRYDIVITLTKLTHHFGADGLEKEYHMRQSLLEAETFEDFCRAASQSLQTLRRYCAEAKGEKTVCDKVINYIDGHFMDTNLTNSLLGSVHSLSPAYLSRIFKEQKGISLTDYLIEKRLEKAKELLADTSLPLDTIANECGFLSSSTLIKTFKKNLGITPGAYRKLWQKAQA